MRVSSNASGRNATSHSASTCASSSARSCDRCRRSTQSWSTYCLWCRYVGRSARATTRSRAIHDVAAAAAAADSAAPSPLASPRALSSIMLISRSAASCALNVCTPSRPSITARCASETRRSASPLPKARVSTRRALRKKLETSENVSTVFVFSFFVSGAFSFFRGWSSSPEGEAGRGCFADVRASTSRLATRATRASATSTASATSPRRSWVSSPAHAAAAFPAASRSAKEPFFSSDPRKASQIETKPPFEPNASRTYPSHSCSRLVDSRRVPKAYLSPKPSRESSSYPKPSASPPRAVASLSSAVMSMTPSASAPSRRRSASEGTAANAAACRPRSTSTIRSWFRCLRGTGSKRLVAWNADARSNVQVNAVSSASASDSSGVSSSSLAVSVSASPSRPRASSAARRGLETSAAESFTETSSARALHATRMSSWMLRSQLTTSSNTTHFSNALGVISRYSLVSSTLLRSASTSPVWTISHAAMRHDASCFGYTIHEGWRHRPSATCR